MSDTDWRTSDGPGRWQPEAFPFTDDDLLGDDDCPYVADPLCGMAWLPAVAFWCGCAAVAVGAFLIVDHLRRKLP